METIQTELSSLLKTFAENSIKQPNADNPFTPPADVVQPPQAPVVEPAIVQPDATKPVEKVVPPIEEPTIFSDWDGSVDTPAPVTPEPQVPVIDFSPLAKVLGKEEIKKLDEVVSEIEQIKRQAEQFKTVPEDLGKAIEIARLGGNYLEYLGVSQVDWAKEDPLVLYENYIEDQFYNPETKLVDYEKVDKLLDTISDDEKELRGRELQRAYINHQKQQKDLILNQAKSSRTQFENSVKEVVNGLSDINGYKLSPAKKAELLEFVMSGEDLKESSVKTRVVNAFVKKYFSQLDSFMKTQVKNATQRKILEEAQVPDIKPVTEQVPVTPSKGYGLTEYLEDIKKQRGFTN